jgi:hypothetical protein
MRRIVQPELLDSLAANDKHALRSRRDLVRINAIMGQPRMMAGALATSPADVPLVDLGGGDGRFLLRVAQRLKTQPRQVLLADRHDALQGSTRRDFRKLGWQVRPLTGDIFDTLETIEPGAVIIANLFLHHFEDDALKRLLALAASRAGAFIACEPRRSHFALFAARRVGWIGANAVSRHDAVVSVRAGFRGKDLTRLWPQTGWRCREGARFPFTHMFIAVKNV